MSIALLQNPEKKHDVLDDIESVLWTMLYGSLHWFTYEILDGSLLDIANLSCS